MFTQSLVALSLALATQSWANPIGARAGSDACGRAAAAVTTFFAENPKEPTAFIAAELAYECLTSVPLYSDPATDLVKSLKGYFQAHSTVDYLRKPPSGYLFDAVDLPRGLDQILDNIHNNKYNSEYDLQVDLNALIGKSHDGHFYAYWDLFGIFQFQRVYSDIAVVSLSKDGKELPKPYLWRDIYVTGANGYDLVLTGAPASPIKLINGIDVEEFLQTQANVAFSQDPDALYNQVTWTLGLHSAPSDNWPSFNLPKYYPGPDTVIEFENGTTYTAYNVAKVQRDLTGITTGEDMYQKFCVPASTTSAPATATSTGLPVGTLPPRQVTEPTRFPGYPTAEVNDAEGKISGYFLDNEVAVLAIRGFEGEDPEFTTHFQAVLEVFLTSCKKAGMKKLILDLMGNGGGYIDLGTDLIAQLFPTGSLDTKSNLRASTGMYMIMQAASKAAYEAANTDPSTHADYAEVLGEENLVPFAWQGVMTPDAKPFNNLHDYYGPHTQANGMFTSFFQSNYTNDLPSQYITGRIDITGYGNRTGHRDQVFDAKNIIVLTDSYCASTCTVVSEKLKNDHGVQFITIGGRPQTGPMQAVGGVKGSQVFDTSIWNSIVAGWFEPTLVNIKEAIGSPWEYFDGVPLLRGFQAVNGRNHYRRQDTSATPLHFVYEAADCRIWWTPEMSTNVTELWDRVSDLAFVSRKDGVIDSPYCVKDSTKHATSISGGLKKGELGPQDPPSNAKSKYQGYLLEGKKIVDVLTSSGSYPAGSVDGYPSGDSGSDKPDIKPGLNLKALASVQDACDQYSGDRWFVQLVCGALG